MCHASSVNAGVPPAPVVAYVTASSAAAASSAAGSDDDEVMLLNDDEPMPAEPEPPGTDDDDMNLSADAAPANEDSAAPASAAGPSTAGAAAPATAGRKRKQAEIAVGAEVIDVEAINLERDGDSPSGAATPEVTRTRHARAPCAPRPLGPPLPPSAR